MEKEKILLGLLPFWEPQIPPLGITGLKSYLGAHGYRVKTVDANVCDRFSDLHNRYMKELEGCVPEGQRGNFHNVGHDVLRNHMTAWLHRDGGNAGGEDAYPGLVKDLVRQTFYGELEEQRFQRLDEILGLFYDALGDYILDLLEGEKPDVLGLSVYRGNLAASMYAFRLAKERYPGMRTVMGGAIFAGELAPGSENLDYFMQKTPYIDQLIAGEGELLFLKYLEGELPEGRRLVTLADVGGETLDLGAGAAPVPDFSDLDLEFYPNLAAYSSRSCPFQCSFCTETVYWGTYRKKKAARVVEEMRDLHRQHGGQLFLMCDSLLNPIVDDLSREMIEGELSLYWDGYLRADPAVCNGDNAFLWRRGGFYRARLGIESGSANVLGLMGKKITVQQIKDAVSALASAGIKTTTYWVVGHPGETEADFRQTLELIEELRDDIYEAWCSPFNYYKTGQVSSGEWEERSQLLYPPQARDMLVVQTWVLDLDPPREEAYRRMARFTEHCRGLGVPNPYSLVDFHRADERWKKLHKNAVPSLVEFNDKANHIDENKYVKKVVTARKKLSRDMTFDF